MDVLSTHRRVSVADPLVLERPTVDTSPLPAGLVVVEVHGEVADSFFTLMRRSLESPLDSVLIDLTRANFFCAAGVSALMELRRHCADIAVTLWLVAPRHVRRPCST